MPLYSLYDRSVRSEFSLEGIGAGTSPPDATFRLGRIGRRSTTKRLHRSNGTVTITYPDGAIAIKGGSTITMDVPSALSDTNLGRIALSQPLAILLHQIGPFVLHGSAVAVDGRAVVFIGPKGRGKSTAALAMYRAGHRVISDDSTAVIEGDPPAVLPGYPILRLRRDVVDVEEPALPLRDPFPDAPKVDGLVGDRFAEAPRPLTRIYALVDAKSIGTELPGSAAMALVANHQFVRLGDDVVTDDDRAEILRRAGSLASRVRMARLPAPEPGNLDAFVDRVERDLANGG